MQHNTRGGGRNEGPLSPLSIELEEVPWPPHFNATILPQYDGESDPKVFPLKYEASIESSRGGHTIKAKTLIMALGARPNIGTRIYRGVIFIHGPNCVRR
jgi:hypothetical protein